MEAMIARKKRLTNEDSALVKRFETVKSWPEKNLSTQKSSVISELQSLNGSRDWKNISTPYTGDLRKVVSMSVDDAKQLETIVRRDPRIDAFEPKDKALIRDFLNKAKRLDGEARNSKSVQFYLQRLELYERYFQVPSR
jgi:hypothetical protein